jgi:hypothetical protein
MGIKKEIIEHRRREREKVIADPLPARARTPPRSWASHPFTAHTVFLVVIVTFTFSAFVVLVAYPALKGEVCCSLYQLRRYAEQLGREHGKASVSATIRLICEG